MEVSSTHLHSGGLGECIRVHAHEVETASGGSGSRGFGDRSALSAVAAGPSPAGAVLTRVRLLGILRAITRGGATVAAASPRGIRWAALAVATTISIAIGAPITVVTPIAVPVAIPITAIPIAVSIPVTIAVPVTVSVSVPTRLFPVRTTIPVPVAVTRGLLGGE